MGGKSLRITPEVLIRRKSSSDSQKFAFRESPASRRDDHGPAKEMKAGSMLARPGLYWNANAREWAANRCEAPPKDPRSDSPGDSQ
jgi:hypothetical protein